MRSGSRRPGGCSLHTDELNMNLPKQIEKAVAFAESNGYAGLREYIEQHARHTLECPHTGVRKIRYLPKVYLPCTCGLEEKA
jgi:hypothetical protein